ncbi:MAG: Coenzyme F420 hydrogenase/dehydrogenase, beta subunit C-terminal domain, partial [Gemmatimonadales bacterium]|nr:Coenzyme F420 hydrogenase/dehydrogenase, beta subunit C-terminal domain [Gemmatimonadales bacterium]
MTVALPVLAPVAGLAAPRARDLCTDCGVSRSSDPSRCGRACQFINPRYAELERRVHGRSRDLATDERWFGPFVEMRRARLAPARAGAQWTGITTRFGERLLELGLVDAVLATASDPADRWAPRPVLVTEPEGMAACRGMKMGFSPLLALLDEAAARGYRRLAVIGIPCQVHALRALEQELGFERLYVIGTPCSDNTTTANFHRFLGLLTDRPEAVTYLEFMPDFHVELRF